ncbi:acyl-coenzyme A thioesterase 1-like [Protopterus annectens]|uniref:acyl-coenzyme A thioesterase 1-like n=1 Tax=Protopterus annectens TaxID=7888 RepID=UPI001CF9C7AE|nr:acyl-coenzyme A thioesterase 1-like [Protopterus annectens]
MTAVYSLTALLFRKHAVPVTSAIRTMAVRLRLLPAAKCLFDHPVQIKIEGLPPNQEVTLKASLADETGELFYSLAHYKAEQNGELDLSQSPSLGGSFSGVEPMGLFWSLAPKTPFKRLMKKNVEQPFCIDIEVYKGLSDVSDQLLAKCTNERWFMKKGVTRIPVREGRIRATLFLPPGPGPFPGVIDLYGTAGGLIEYRASLLASHGFATLALAYFGFEDLPSTLEGFHLEYFEEAAYYLQKHPKVNKNGIGVVGISKGADLALSMASFLPGVKAAVSISGCSSNLSSFLHYKGLTIPPLLFSVQNIKFTDKGAIIFRDAIHNPCDMENKDSIIPIERASGNFLFLAGEDDQNAPSPMFLNEAVKRLQEYGKQNFESYCYPGAGHLLEPPYSPVCHTSWHKIVGAALVWGGEGKAHSWAQQDAWQKIQTFLHKHLGYEMNRSRI